MSAVPGNVRALRPIKILLSSDDDRFAHELEAAAHDRSLGFAHVAADVDIEVALFRHAANIYVLDAGSALQRAARSATAFAELHPGIPVVVVADRAASPTLGSVALLDKWRSAERLLGEIERTYLGLRR